MDLPSNPFAALTFISAPAVLTNASCVLLFGTGNRYGRAVLDPAELDLRIRQLGSAQTRTLLIVRAPTCFYIAVAAFVASTLVSLIGVILVSSATTAPTPVFILAFSTGSLGVLAMIAGALMLAVESRFSFSVLRQENAFITGRIHSLTNTTVPHPEP
jgi:hypothetical protein